MWCTGEEALQLSSTYGIPDHSVPTNFASPMRCAPNRYKGPLASSKANISLFQRDRLCWRVFSWVHYGLIHILITSYRSAQSNL